MLLKVRCYLKNTEEMFNIVFIRAFYLTLVIPSSHYILYTFHEVVAHFLDNIKHTL